MALENTWFSLSQSGIKESSEIRHSVAFPSFCFGYLDKDVEKCKVESSAYKWIKHLVRLSTKEYKGRTDNYRPTGPNQAACVATFLL